MTRLFSFTVAAAALSIAAAPALAQSQPGDPYGDQSYGADEAYPYDPNDPDPYGAPPPVPYGDPGEYGDQMPGAYPDDDGPYQPDDGYDGDPGELPMEDDGADPGDYGGDPGDYGPGADDYAMPPYDDGAMGDPDQYQYGEADEGGYGEEAPLPEAGEDDLTSRESALEARIHAAAENGMLNPDAANNALVELNSIRNQHAELVRRDGALTETTRGFIEDRLAVLEGRLEAMGVS
jgi:hypothetical protein